MWVMKINNFLAAALSFEPPTLGIYRISSNSFTETILSWICKMNELQTVATNFNFLPTILNFCSGNYSRKELFKGQKYSWEYGSQRSSCFAMLMLLIRGFQVQILFDFFLVKKKFSFKSYFAPLCAWQPLQQTAAQN